MESQPPNASNPTAGRRLRLAFGLAVPIGLLAGGAEHLAQPGGSKGDSATGWSNVTGVDVLATPLAP